MQTNLRKLTSQLSAQCTSGSDERSQASARLADNLPLAHSTPSLRVFKDIDSSGCLLSADRLLHQKKIPSANTEKRLGTAVYAFTYCGAARLPYAKGCALLFRSEVEKNSASGSEKMEATPFDSGGIVKVYMPGADQGKQRQFLDRFTLPVPGYRTVLGRFMACYFGKIEDYVNGVVKPNPKPPWITKAAFLRDARAWTFEVRFEDALSTEYIEAVIVERAASSVNTWLRKWLNKARQQNIEVRYYDVMENDDTVEQHDWLARAVAEYILDSIRGKPNPNGAVHEDAH